MYSTKSELQVGKVDRVLPDGYGFVHDLVSKHQYVFSLAAIPNYRGQSPQELRLHKGSGVRFRADGDRVEYLELD